MRRVLFQWRGIKVFSYPAMLYLGMVAGVIGGTYGAGVHGLDPSRVLPAMLLLVAAALAGSRLCFAAIKWYEFRGNPSRFLQRSEGGAAQYGGLALAFLVSLPLLRALDVPIGGFWDAGIVTILIGKVFTRFGCLLNGCCCGRPNEGLFALHLPNVNGVWRRRIPTQLLEAILAALLLAASLYAWGRLPFGGAVFLGNLAVYGIARNWLEQLRECSNRGNTARFNRVFSVGMAVVSVVVFLIGWLVGSAPSVPGSLAHPVQASISPAYLALTPLAVLAVLSLFHFTGCDLVFPLDDISVVDGYPNNILGETNSSTVDENNSICVSYWRLDDAGPSVAKDLKANVDGTFNSVTLPPLPDVNLDDDHSPTTAQPVGTIILQAPGLLGHDDEVAAFNNSMEVNGGFMEVPATSTLILPHFTIEALVFPLWDITDLGRWYCVVEHSSPVGNKRFGIGIYGGPEGTGAAGLNTAYRWQVWLGIDNAGVTRFTQILPVTGPTRPLPLVEPNKTNYLAVTFDGSNIKLWATFEGKLSSSGDLTMDQLLAVDEPLAPGVFTPNPVPTPFLIGMGRDLFIPFNPAGEPRYPFNGRIQEVAVYNEALTPERVLSHMQAALKDL